MSDPALALQGAIDLALAAAVTAVSGRVFDRVPAEVVFPYIEIGEAQTLDDGAQCVDAVAIVQTVHVWSNAVGQGECRTIAGAVRGTLHEAELDLGPAWQFLEIAHQATQHLKDPDGATSHAVLTFRALVAAA